MCANESLRLKGLVKVLTHQKIRDLRSAIENIDLHYDVIVKLPLEISQTILQYLPLYQIFQDRRVSSEWRQVLSSAQTVEPLLRDWYPKRALDLGLEIPKILSAESITSLKAEHVDAYRTGHAFLYARHKWPYSSNFIDSIFVEYADGI